MAWGRVEAEADSPLGRLLQYQAEVLRAGLEGNSREIKNKMVVPTLVDNQPSGVG